jgi:hypothetical protein
VILCALATLSLAAPTDPSRYRAGLRNSTERYKLSAKQLNAVLESLRDKTGFLGMRFDEAGFLTLGDRTRMAGGSAAARALLVAAVDGTKSFDLENHDRSRNVAFARLAPAIIYESRVTGARIEALPLELDFFDFAQLRGEKEVIAAFDLGLAVLHELAHGVLHLRDTEAETGGLGECEDYINRIRRELGLPERQHYIARAQRVSLRPNGPTVDLVELTFARSVNKQGRAKTEQSYLSWELERVGTSTGPPGPKANSRDPASAVAMQER